jgi:hypothetical protein
MARDAPMMQNTGFVIGAVVVVALTVMFAHISHRYVYGYDIKNYRIRLLLFNLVPLLEIPIADIQEVRVCSAKDLWRPSFAFRCGNRMWGECVLIQKKSGFVRTIIITPDNSAEFIERVKTIQTNQSAAR